MISIPIVFPSITLHKQGRDTRNHSPQVNAPTMSDTKRNYRYNNRIRINFPLFSSSSITAQKKNVRFNYYPVKIFPSYCVRKCRVIYLCEYFTPSIRVRKTNERFYTTKRHSMSMVYSFIYWKVKPSCIFMEGKHLSFNYCGENACSIFCTSKDIPCPTMFPVCRVCVVGSSLQIQNTV